MAKQFIEDLIDKMTLEEKLAQMTQLSPLFFSVEENADVTGPLREMNLNKETIKNIGSTLNYFGASNLKALQRNYLENNPHKIPLIFMADVIHGYKTIFPIPLALGCSFNPENYKNAAACAAKECSASGIHLTFSPMTDLVRDPRWGRVMESTGEDPYLNSLMAAAAVKGFQGDDVKESGKIAACVKHFAGYGASEGGRDYNRVEISAHSFMQYYLSSYRAAIDAGVKMVMTSFNVVDGIPASASKKLMKDILREEMGFEGTVISDYAAVDETITHGVAKDGMEAAKLCINAGVDIEMMSAHYINYGRKLVEEGLISMENINNAVRNILILKDDLGLFENPYKDASEENEKRYHLCEDHRQLARNAACESIVLLKNNNLNGKPVLPLSSGIRVGLAGPFSCCDNTMGGWSITNKKDSVTLHSALIKKGMSVVTVMDKPLGAMQDKIFDIDYDTNENFDCFSDCDIIIAAVGENPADTGEAASKTNLRLTPNQERMIYDLKKLNKPIIMIVFSGRPLEIKPVLPCCEAVLQAWFLGTESGNGIADILSGDFNPQGRLSMSFPHTVGQVPVYYNCIRTGRPDLGQNDRFVSKYLDCPNEPLYSFGYGLSYSAFEYSNLDVSWNDEEKSASIYVENVSDIAGTETVQLYIHNKVSHVVRPVKELRGFQKVYLNPQEKKKVTFTLTEDMFWYYDPNLNIKFETGEFDIMIGKNSSEVWSGTIKIQ